MTSIPQSGGSPPKKFDPSLGNFSRVGKDVTGRAFSFLSTQDMDTLGRVSKTFRKMSKKDWSEFLQNVNLRVAAITKLEIDEKFKKQSEAKKYSSLEGYIKFHEAEADLKTGFIEFFKDVMLNEEQGNVPIGVVEMFIKAGILEDTNLYAEAFNRLMGFEGGGDFYIKPVNSHIYQLLINEFRDSKLQMKEKSAIIQDHFERCKKSFVINPECLRAISEAGLKLTKEDLRYFIQEGKRQAPKFLDQVCASVEFLINKEIVPRDELLKMIDELAPKEADHKMAEESDPEHAQKQFFNRVRLAVKPIIRRASSSKKKDTSVDQVD